MITLHSTVRDYLNDATESSTADREANNAYARKTTLLLFLTHLLVFKYCLNVPSSSETFTSARWTLLQVCPHVLFDQDIFNILFLQLLNLRHHPTGHLLALIRNEYEEATECLSSMDAYQKSRRTPGFWWSTMKHSTLPISSLTPSSRYLRMSPRSSCYHQSSTPFKISASIKLTLVTCGTGLSI
jgi:hypothetical protein